MNYYITMEKHQGVWVSNIEIDLSQKDLKKVKIWKEYDPNFGTSCAQYPDSKDWTNNYVTGYTTENITKSNTVRPPRPIFRKGTKPDVMITVGSADGSNVGLVNPVC